MDSRSVDGMLDAGIQVAAAAVAVSSPAEQLNFDFALLPQDCLQAVLAFLSVPECLTFGSASISSLKEICPDLLRRQKRMTQKFGYIRVYHEKDLHKPFRLVGPIVPGSLTETKKPSVIILPTVLDRLNVLARVIPTTHPLATDVRQLRDDILATSVEDPHGSNNTDTNTSTTTVTTTTRTSNALSSPQTATLEHILWNVRRLTRTHRRHAQILRRATCSESIDQHDDRGRAGRGHSWESHNGSNLTTTLARYMGDVLCACYLMGHIASGIVQAGPTEQQWMNSLDQALAMHTHTTNANEETLQVATSVVTPESSYRAWIFIHSTLLRTAPFTRPQLLTIGIDSVLSTGTALPPTCALQPCAAFAGCRKAEFVQRLLRRGTIQPLSVTTNHFGRLGPTFRGRDSIFSRTTFPSGPLEALLDLEQAADEQHSSLGQVVAISSLSEPLSRWVLMEHPVMQWLMRLHQEAGKTRPMTVAPPRVTIRAM